MQRYFITGTDTNCGKTYVTSELTSFFNQQGLKAQALKPVASGCLMQDAELISEDVVSLQATNFDAKLSINGWCFAEPIAPHLAAKNASTRLSAADIAQFCETEVFSKFDRLLIEGAGGLLVPLNEKETWLDFLKLTAIPVIVVVGMRLGCINHALLTDAVLRANQIACCGWVANCLDKDMLALEENIASIEDRLSMPLLGRVGYAEKGVSLKSFLS